ncbi:AraC family transcriptional regulator [Methylobacterium sp. JK268]
MASASPERVLRLRFEPPADPAATGQAWCDHIAPVFEVHLRPETDLSGPLSMVTYHLGDLIVGDVVAPAHTLERAVPQIRAQGLDHLLLQFYRSGRSVVETEHHSTPVGESELVLFDLAQPVLITAEPVAATNLLVPRIHLERLGIDCGALHGRAFDHDADPLLRLFHSFLQNVVACGDDLATDRAPDLAHAIVRLCAAALKGRAGSGGAVTEIGIAVRRFIQRELAKPDLGAETICAHFGLSRSVLYRLFEADCGVVSYIRDRRLLHAMRLLAEGSAAAPVRISTLAYSLGFADEKTFTRAFKRRFGFAPSRVATGAAGRVAVERGVSALLEWIKTLSP